MSSAPTFTGVYLFVRDMARTVAFYRQLGCTVDEVSEDFGRIAGDGGRSFEFGTTALTRSYDPAWQETSGPGTNTLSFTLASRDAVDAMYAELTAAGHRGHLAPIDAPWGSRFAIVFDPDDNFVGMHSPREAERESLAPAQ